jgi:hypothetical protein
LSKRNNIIQALLDTFVDTGVVLSANVTRRLAFLHEVNDFPAICTYTPRETRTHYGDGRRIAQITLNVRGYSYSGDDAIGECELLARSIEDAVDTYARAHPDLGLYEARVLSLRTDEGLYAPHGITDLTVQITYEV